MIGYYVRVEYMNIGQFLQIFKAIIYSSLGGKNEILYTYNSNSISLY